MILQTLEQYPKECRWSIKTVAKELHTDYETAYAMIALNALLMDLYPSDVVVVRMILDDCTKEKARN